MRELEFDLRSDKKSAVYCFGGYQKEHNETKISVRLPQRMQSEDDAQYRFVFETAEEELVFSPPVSPNEGVLHFTLPQQLMLPPELKFYVASYRYDQGQLIQLAKTGVVVLEIQPLPEKNETEYSSRAQGEKEAFVDREVTKDSENPVSGGAVYASLQKQKKEIFQQTAGALLGNGEGNPLRLSDVSPLPHEMTVRVTRKNLFDFEKFQITAAQNASLEKKDGGVKVILTEKASPAFVRGTLLPLAALDGKHIVLSCTATSSGENTPAVSMGYFSSDGSIFNTVAEWKESGSVAMTVDLSSPLAAGCDCLGLWFYGNQDATDGFDARDWACFDDLTLQADLSGESLYCCGKNLFSFEKAVVGGVSFLPQEQGIHISGTKTQATAISVESAPLTLPAGSYTVSGKPEGEIRLNVYVNGFLRYTVGTEGYSFLLPEESQVYATLTLPEGAGASLDLLAPVMLEAGERLGEYEPFRKNEFSISQNDPLIQVPAFSPTVTLFSGQSANLEVTYHRDVNKMKWEGESISVDAQLSESSTNPVENRVVTNALSAKADQSSLASYLPLSGGMVNRLLVSNPGGALLDLNSEVPGAVEITQDDDLLHLSPRRFQVESYDSDLASSQYFILSVAPGEISVESSDEVKAAFQTWLGTAAVEGDRVIEQGLFTQGAAKPVFYRKWSSGWMEASFSVYVAETNPEEIVILPCEVIDPVFFTASPDLLSFSLTGTCITAETNPAPYGGVSEYYAHVEMKARWKA